MLFKKCKTFLIYVLAYHFLRQFCEIMLPNLHYSNLVRGYLLGLFFKSRGKRLAIGSGVILNCPWNIVVGDNVYFAHRCWINASGGLVVGDGAIFSPNVVIATTAHDRVNGRVSLKRSRVSGIKVGDGVWVASNSVVSRGSTIGDGVVVSSCSVVKGNLDCNWLYVGNPAVKVRSLEPQSHE